MTSSQAGRPRKGRHSAGRGRRLSMPGAPFPASYGPSSITLRAIGQLGRSDEPLSQAVAPVPAAPSLVEPACWESHASMISEPVALHTPA